MKKIYTEEQRNEILQRYRSGEKVESICEDTGIAKSTLYAWTKSNNKKKSKAINMSDFRILRQRCETLEKMVEVLQLSPAPSAHPCTIDIRSLKTYPALTPSICFVKL